MARTFNDLFPRLCSWENLLEAYRKARRHKRYKPYVCDFEASREEEILKLQAELASGAYLPGPYTHFLVHEPKRRKISAAPFRDRVVHHALVNVLEPIWEPRFVQDSFACRRGKGTHRAVRRCQGFLKRFPYFLKCDVVKFFPNVDHAVLFDVIARKVSDARVLALIGQVLASGAGVLEGEAPRETFPGDDLLELMRPRGLPIGNLTSQFFANVLLDRLDHAVKDGLGVKGYVRYCNDFLIWGDSKDRLWRTRDDVQVVLDRLRLKLHAKKTMVSWSRDGVKFLGLKVYPEGRRLLLCSVARFNRRLRALKRLSASGVIPLERIRRSLAGWLAHAAHANSRALSRAVLSRLRVRPRAGAR